MRDGTILDFSESNHGSDGMNRYADHRYISNITYDWDISPVGKIIIKNNLK